MVYKKYIKKEGKKFGPYFYESYRDSKGNVKTRYLTEKEASKSRGKVLKNIFILSALLIGIVALLGAFIYFNNDSFTNTTSFGKSAGAVISNVYNAITGHTIDEAGSDSASSSSSDSSSDSSSSSSESSSSSVSESSSSDSGESSDSSSEIVDSSGDSNTEVINGGVVVEVPPLPPTPIIEEPEQEEPVEEELEETTEETSEVPEEPSEEASEEQEEASEEPSEPVEEEQEEAVIANETSEETPEEASEETEVPTQENETESGISEGAIEVNETDVLPETETNETIINEAINVTKTISTRQYTAVLGKPVRWVKNVKIETSETLMQENIELDLPSLAGNVSVKKIDAETGEETEIEDALVSNEKLIEEVDAITSITGNVVSSEQAYGKGVISNFFEGIASLFNSILSLTGKVIEGEEAVSVSLTEDVSNEDEIIVEYYTDAPYAEETEIENGKQINIIGPDEVHYEDILAFTNLGTEVESKEMIKIYWTTSDSGEKEEVVFDAYDINENGLIDYIEWIVPHLSVQTYEIILITKAVHLDIDKQFVSDIYGEVQAQDGVWSEVVGNGEYVRVTFEQELDNTKDITLYARGSEGSSIEVYEKDGVELLATFDSITAENTYKIYLTELMGVQDTFDLKVLGSVEFDYIVDPTYPENGTYYIVSGNGLTGASQSPNGSYYFSGVYNGYDYYTRDDNGFDIWYKDALYGYVITLHPFFDVEIFSSSGRTTISGDYLSMTGSGTATATAGSYYAGYTIYDCGNITQSGTYTLNQSFSWAGGGTCLNITSDDVVLDFNDNYISLGASADNGVYISGKDNVTVKGGSITDFTNGVYVHSSTNVNVSDMIFYSDGAAIYFYSVNNSFISDITFEGNAYDAGISLGFSNNNVIARVSAISSISGVGFHLSFSNNNLVSNVSVFSGASKGTTVEFSDNNTFVNLQSYDNVEGEIYSNEWISSTGNTLIYNNTFGEIKFLNQLDADVEGTLRFGSGYNIQIGNNSAYLNSTDLSELNKSANITLRNTGITTPIILKDGATCADCTLLSSAGTTHVFNVTSWSNYSLMETIGCVGQDAGTVFQCGNNVNESCSLNGDMLSQSGTCFNITADNVTLDGNGFSIDGDDTDNDYGIYASGRDNVTVKDFNNITDFYVGIQFEDVANSLVYNLSSSSNIYDGIWMIRTNDSRVEDVVLSGNSIGLMLTASADNIFDNVFVNPVLWIDNSADSGNQFINLNIFSNLADYSSAGVDYLIYNNSFGEIKWIDSALLTDLTTSGDITFPGNITLANNSAYVNSAVLSSLNKSANVTLYNVGNRGYSNPRILKGGVVCVDCYNYTSLIADTVIFNVTSWSNYTIGEGPDIVDPIINIISPTNQTYGNVAIIFNISANEALATCIFSLNSYVTNYSMTLNVSSTGANYSLSGLTTGSYTSKFWCNDTSGNVNNTNQVIFSVDAIVPILAIVSPLNQTYYSNITSLDFNVSSNEEIDRCLFSLNSAENITMTEINSTYFNYTKLTSSLSEGSQTVILSCNDSYGNINSSSVVFSYDSLNTLDECRTLDETNGVYILQNDVSATENCFTIAANNITLDLNGYNITGNSVGLIYAGVYINGYNSTTIKNGAISYFSSYGVYLASAYNTSINNMTISRNVDGIYLVSGKYSNISNIASTLNYDNGIELYLSHNNTLSDLRISSNDGYGISLTSSSNNTFDNINSSLNDYYGISINGHSNIVKNITVGSNGDSGIYIINSNSNIISDINSYSNNEGLSIQGQTENGATGNVITNLNSYDNTGNEFGYSVTIGNNYLIYNNSFGEISFGAITSSITENLILGSTLNITNNSVVLGGALASSALNKSANITLNLPYFEGNYPSILQRLGIGGLICNSTTVPSCNNFTAVDATPLKFNVSNFGNGVVSYGKNIRSKSEVVLNTGWNMVGLEMEGNETGDRNISVVSGWNLIGFSSSFNETSVSLLKFTNASGTEYTWDEAATAGKVQKYIAYYDSSSAENKKYKYAPFDTSSLTNQKGYWIRAFEAGNVTLPAVGGNNKTITYGLSNLMFRNASGVEKNVSDAVSEGWVGRDGVTNLANDVWYWDVSDPEYPEFRAISSKSSTFSSWEGVFVWGKKDNITMLRQN